MEYFKNIWHCLKPSHLKFRRAVLLQFILFFILGITLSNLLLLSSSVFFPPKKIKLKGHKHTWGNNTIWNKIRTWDNITSTWNKVETTSNSIPTVYVATPTYRNPFQLAELTRTAQALLPSRAFVHWLIWEDSEKTKSTFPNHVQLLQDHLQEFFPNIFTTVGWSTPKNGSEVLSWHPRGVEARRDSIQFIRNNLKEGVLYFADDDNTYDSQLFKMIQMTKKITVWPVGSVTRFGFSSPVVDKRRKVVDFYDGYRKNRRFPIDFAGFALNTRVLLKNPNGNILWRGGYEETLFLSSLNTNIEDLHPICSNATELLTWHTKMLKHSLWRVYFERFKNYLLSWLP